MQLRLLAAAAALREWIDWRWVFAIFFLIFMYLVLTGVITDAPADPGNWNDPDPRPLDTFDP